MTTMFVSYRDMLRSPPAVCSVSPFSLPSVFVAAGVMMLAA